MSKTVIKRPSQEELDSALLRSDLLHPEAPEYWVGWRLDENLKEVEL